MNQGNGSELYEFKSGPGGYAVWKVFDNSEEIFCGNIVGSIRHCGFQLFKAG